MREAAEALRLTAQDLNKLGVADVVIPEPIGGAQRNKQATIENVKSALLAMMAQLEKKKPDALRKARRKKFLDMGAKSLA